MARTSHLYTGAAGQAAAMSEFLIRGYNVAVPEVDRGDDLFVVKDMDGDFNRIQVKTATAKSLRKSGYIATFSISSSQLSEPITPELFYVLVVRHGSVWSDYVVISQSDLLSEHLRYQVGTRSGANVLLRLNFRPDSVRSGSRDFQTYRGNFSHWPPLLH
jgi:hypothetical protein